VWVPNQSGNAPFVALPPDAYLGLHVAPPARRGRPEPPGMSLGDRFDVTVLSTAQPGAEIQPRLEVNQVCIVVPPRLMQVLATLADPLSPSSGRAGPGAGSTGGAA